MEAASEVLWNYGAFFGHSQSTLAFYPGFQLHHSSDKFLSPTQEGSEPVVGIVTLECVVQTDQMNT